MLETQKYYSQAGASRYLKERGIKATPTWVSELVKRKELRVEQEGDFKVFLLQDLQNYINIKTQNYDK